MPQPTYREAHPRLDIREVQTATGDGRLVCQYTDQTGRDLGQVFVLGQPEGEVVICYFLHGPYIEFASNFIRLGVEHVPDPVNPWRHFFSCPRCKQRFKTVFYFHRHWSCADCHGLGFRSPLLPRNIRMGERIAARREELHAKLKAGRPHRMRQATYDRQRRELAQLTTLLKNHPLWSVSADHQHIVTGRWMAAQDLPNGLAHEGFSIQYGEIIKEDWFRLPPAIG